MIITVDTEMTARELFNLMFKKYPESGEKIQLSNGEIIGESEILTYLSCICRLYRLDIMSVVEIGTVVYHQAEGESS